jgi:glucosamine--fructose-6-phosphate aminotransferase (isomerizing)
LDSYSSSAMKEIFRAECLEQPARLAEVFRAYSADREIRAELERLKKSVSSSQPLVWLGMGASYCSAISGATRFSLAGRPAFCVEASEWLHFAFSTWDHVAGPILITTSGESAELVELCRQQEKSPRILICNFPESSCWEATDIRLPILSGNEKGNATQSYTNCTAICTLLASELLGQPWQADAAQVMQAFTQSLDQAFSRGHEIEEVCRGMKTLEVVGRGAAVGGAIMGALCVREMTGWRANAHSGGSFRHGPFLDVNSSHVAMILALGATAEMGRRLARDCVAKGGKAVLVVDQDPVEKAEGLLTVKIQPVPEGWEGLTSVLIPQALAQALIERLGSGYVRTSTTIE